VAAKLSTLDDHRARIARPPRGTVRSPTIRTRSTRPHSTAGHFRTRHDEAEQKTITVIVAAAAVVLAAAVWIFISMISRPMFAIS
jgi:hypothetical protein